MFVSGYGAGCRPVRRWIWRWNCSAPAFAGGTSYYRLLGQRLQKKEHKNRRYPLYPPPPPQLEGIGRPFALVTALQYYSEIKKQLSELEIPCCTVDAYVVWKHLDGFRKVYQMLDAESQGIYAALLLSRIKGDPSGIRGLCSGGQYFALPEFRFCGSQESFVDCGAFTGENVETFLWNISGLFHKIYAFEGNPAAMAAMRRRLARQGEVWLFKEGQIVLEEKFVGAKSGVQVPVSLNETNPAGSSIDWDFGGCQVEQTALDAYFRERGEEKITFLKADIEGAEWDMLHGAKELIQRGKPKIAVCIYHSAYDLFRIPLLLKTWVPEYRMAVRHHWNGFSETVLYCYV